MTREEAIKILKDCELNPCVSKDKEAANMAIKALEQESYETVTEFADKCRECGSILGRNTKQKTGRWLSHKEYCEKHDLIPSGLVTLEWCSNCDFGIDINEMHGEHYKYCPMCGEKKEV